MILELFKYVFQQLEERKIDYFLSGSYALNVYSTPRMTRDIDIVINLNFKNLENFLAIFSDDYYYDKSAIKNEIKLKRMFNIIHQTELYKFDFIINNSDEYSNIRLQRKRKEKINGFYAWTISPEDLVISKLQWIQDYESDLHLNDIDELLAIPDLDKEYIVDWCTKLHLKTYNLFL